MSETIEFKRKVRGLNRTAMHRRTGITVSHISRVFSGKRMPSTQMLARIADDMGVSMDTLYQYLRTIRRSRGRGRGDSNAA